MSDTVFTRIIKGEIPCHKVYEDASTLAFLDIHPVVPGMVVVVPKVQTDNIEDLDEEMYAALWGTVRKAILKLRRAYPDKKKIGIQVEGFDVPHAHVKLYPINSGKELHAEVDMSTEPDHKELAEIAERINSND